jgi:hypothetical protein
VTTAQHAHAVDEGNSDSATWIGCSGQEFIALSRLAMRWFLLNC